MRRGGSSVLRLYAKVLHHRLVLIDVLKKLANVLKNQRLYTVREVDLMSAPQSGTQGTQGCHS